MRLYSVKVDWQIKSTEQQPANPPVIIIQHLAMVDHCAPSTESVGSQSNMFMIASAAEPEMSHLELIPRKPESRSGGRTSPIILAVFSHVPETLSGGQMRDSPYSVFVRWELAEEKPSLDPTFTQLASKNAMGNDLKVHLWQRLFTGSL